MAAPILVVDHASHLPPFEQVHTQIRTLIASGGLASGAQLPSVRQLARDLDVAPNTVVKAYAELESEGWIVSKARRGFIVAPDVNELAQAERTRQLESAVRHLVDMVDMMGVDIREIRAAMDRIQESRGLPPSLVDLQR